MTNLSITESQDDLPVIKRAKKSLIKGIKLTSSKDLDKAVQLSNYLLATGEIDHASDLLDSFIYSVESAPGRRDVWGSNGQGIILRAYIAGFKGDEETRSKLIKIILDDDIMTDRCDRYELYLECKEDHEESMSYAMSETPKYKCEVYGQEALTFLYFLEMLPFYKEIVPDSYEEELRKLIEECYQALKEALKN